MAAPRPYSRQTLEAAALLGAQIRVARIERGWTVEGLAERVGATHVTIRRVERGDLRVAVGVVFEAATLVGVPLFHPDRERRELEGAWAAQRLALLPSRVREKRKVPDAF